MQIAMSREEKTMGIQDKLQIFATAVYLFQQQVANKLHLYPTDFHCIQLLDQHGSLAAGELAKKLGLTSGATTAVIDRLTELGYVERTASDTDRRRIMVQLNPDNIQTMRLEYASIVKQVQDGLEQFSEAELDTIDRFLGIVTGI